jgi:hypothetical protein
MVLGLLELVLLGLVLAVIASQLWSVSARQTLFVAVGSMGLVLLTLIVLGVGLMFLKWNVNMQLREQTQVVQLRKESDRQSAVQQLAASGEKDNQPATKKPVVIEDVKSKDRPAWVDTPAGLADGKFERTVSAGPYDTPSLCESELITQIRHAVNEYADGYIGPGTDRALKFTDPDLLKLIGQRWVQQVDTSVGPMMYHHARLVLDDSARAEIKQMWRHDTIERRLQWLGGGALVVLSSLLGGYVLLKRQPAG